MEPIIAIDFGGTHIRAALFPSDSPSPERQVKIQTRAEDGPQAVLDRIEEAIRDVLPADTGGLRIGIASPGPLDPFRGVVLSMANLPGWQDIPIAADISSRFGCPVVVNNDANLAALGEWKHGAGRGVNDLIYLTISTGIGGGVVTHSHLLLGANGLGGELGHMTVVRDGPRCGCGQRGHIEAVASGPSVARYVRQRLEAGEHSIMRDMVDEIKKIDAIIVGEAAKHGDALAIEAIKKAGQAIGSHLASLVHAFNPARIIIGGGFSQVGEFLFEPIKQALRDEVIHPAYIDSLEVLLAELGDDAGLIGAMVLARQARDES